MKTPLLATLFNLSTAAFAAAQDAPTLVVRGGHLFDPERLERRALDQLWIAGERVLGERAADTAIPAGVAVLDAGAHTIVPGLFDLHAHVGSHGGSFTQASDGAENLQTALLCGVTNVVDLHGDPASIFALRDRSRSDHALARLWCAGAAFTAPKGHASQFGFAANVVANADDVAARFAALLPREPDVIKLIVEHGGWGGLPELPTLEGDLPSLIVRAAHQAGLRAVCHVWSLAEAKVAVAAGVDGLVHGVFLGKVDDELADAMAKAATAYVPTLSVVLASVRAMRKQRPYDHDLVREVLHPDLAAYLNEDDVAALATSPMARMARNQEPTYLQNLKTLFDRKVPIGLGTDAGNPLVPHGPGVLLELELYVAAGLTPAQALRAATLDSARIFGIEAQFGALAPGKAADLVLVAGDPVADIAAMWNVKDVVKAGQRVDRSAVRTRNAERSKPAPVVQVRPGDNGPGFPFGGKFELSVDKVAGGSSSGEFLATSEHLLHMRGEVRAGFQWGPWTGASVLWHPQRRFLVDASACAGVRLRLRGTARALTVTLHSAAVRDFNVFVATVRPTAEMQTIDVPFASLRQIGFGKTVTWTGKDIVGLALEYRCAPLTKPQEGAVELEVAAVEF
jgi:imidazolonepropionase-like amidohydrolase